MTNQPRSVRVQYLVVGSGAGGAITAVELARAGFEVVVLEEGARHGLDAYGKGVTHAMQTLYRNRGMTPILGSVPIGFVEGRCLGGSTEINSGFWHRMPPEFVLRWVSQFGINDFSVEQLAPHYQWCEEQLKVVETGDRLQKNSEVFKRGVESMGWSARAIPRAAGDCVNTNQCASGCPQGAKQGMTRNLVPLAEAAGCKFITNCKVKLLLKAKNRVTGVLAEIKREDNSTDLVRIDADHVFLCAGATQTPALLRRSGIKSHVGDTFQIHPMLKVSALFDEEIDAHKSVMPVLQVKEFWPDIQLGGSFFSTGQLAMNLSDNWTESQHLMRDYRKMATYNVAVRSTGYGSVRPARFGSEYAILRFELSDVDIRNLSQGLARLASLLLRAGAKSVHPCIQSLPAITSELDAVKWLDENLSRSSLSLTAVHAFSTCPMGERRDRCAVDSYGKVFGFENLFVNDASMLPESPGINPQGTIMAIARRNVLNFIANKRG
ncbi:GMC family oxidoreductase [Candidatus Obscuribacterales bacterium]|nr:GMC family oxidoreductase [Candidatus Obscuribacterales bacterium]MBX3152931.1 GMC family oxidoreductase [Candidatus Obscuribacterales bacterium]